MRDPHQHLGNCSPTPPPPPPPPPPPNPTVTLTCCQLTVVELGEG